MTAFLIQHSRYHTMHSWNRSTSYANSVKLHHVPKPSDIDEDSWWQMLTVPDWHDTLRDLFENFAGKHTYAWQAGINGRSGGYVVLYRGGIKPSGYKSYCRQCSQKNYQALPEGETGVCGRCNAEARVNFQKTHMQIFTWPGKDIDMHEDFTDWVLSDLRERVELVQDFDQLCTDIIQAYCDMCKAYRITDEEILVPKTIKVLESMT